MTLPSSAAIQRELDQHPDICLGRQDVAIRRIKQRQGILGYCRNLRSLERDHANHKASISAVSRQIESIEERLGVDRG